MSRMRTAAWALALLTAGGGPRTSAFAQPVELVGTRALGMAGAFVAVADDPSAVYWNPAGLADGHLVGVSADLQRLDQPARDFSAGAVPAAARSYLVAGATPPLGLAYYRIGHAGHFSAGQSGSASPDLARLVTDQVAVTLVQTVWQSLTIGAALKFLHGSAGSGVADPASTPSEIRDQAWDLASRGSSAFDVDLGARGTVGPVSLGLVARNLAASGFDAPSGTTLTLDRQVRIGAAIRPADGWVLAADADLTTTNGLGRPTRRAALGAEHWFAGRSLALRGGLRLSTYGPPAPVVAGGASVAIQNRVWLEAQGCLGDAAAERGWGVGLRFAY